MLLKTRATRRDWISGQHGSSTLTSVLHRLRTRPPTVYNATLFTRRRLTDDDDDDACQRRSLGRSSSRRLFDGGGGGRVGPATRRLGRRPMTCPEGWLHCCTELQCSRRSYRLMTSPPARPRMRIMSVDLIAAARENEDDDLSSS